MHAARIDAVRKFLLEKNFDAFLLTDPPDVRWCCGFTGSSGFLLVDQSRATLITDSRYQVQAVAEVGKASGLSGVKVEIQRESAIDHISESGLLSRAGSLGIDSWRITVAFAADLEEHFPDVELHPIPSPFKVQIAEKHGTEVAALRRAQAVTDAVFDEILQSIRPGLTEVEIASEIVHAHLIRGAEEMSFPPIVASGPNGALPHARPSKRRIRNGELIVLDFGCFVDGYASDMSRTISVGRPDADALKAYDVVHSAQRAAQDEAQSGMRAGELDRIAREVIEKAGYGRTFIHSLGHGLGLRVHEWPRIARRCDDILPENAVITIEPGIYVADSFGIRIENSVLLSSSGSEQLPKSDTSLIVI